MTNQIEHNEEVIANESFRDRLATMENEDHRKWIFAQKPKGKLYTWRSLVSSCFFLLFFSLPFIEVNGRPLFLFNVTQAKFIFFGKVFWPQDFFLFGIGLITFIVFIILFTAAFGRLFCGWVCPQTIFMEMFFRKVEYLIEGSANSQELLAKAPWTVNKITKKLTKHAVFYIASFVIANFFLSYIIGIRELWKIITEPVSKHVGGLLSIAIFSAVFYAVYAYFREQVCTVVCPYGRLQGVLLDSNSMIVAYDYKRGEPRGKFTQKTDSGLGDCIDCGECVKVCPTGIDIRNGTQMGCIGCTACIDACNSIMKKVNRPGGLVRYASQTGIEQGEKLHYTGRMTFYTILLGIMILILFLLLFTRKDVDSTIMRTPGLLYQEKGTDSVSNLYNINITNKTTEQVPVHLKLENMQGNIEMIGEDHIDVKEQAQGSGLFSVILPRKMVHSRKIELKIGLYENEKRIDVIKTNFLGPVSN